jgi:hypothetical protein
MYWWLPSWMSISASAAGSDRFAEYRTPGLQAAVLLVIMFGSSSSGRIRRTTRRTQSK